MTSDATLTVDPAVAAPSILLSAKTATNEVFNLVNSDEVNAAVIGDEKLETLQDRVINRLINSEKDLMSIRNALRKEAREAKKAQEADDDTGTPTVEDPQAAAHALVAEATGKAPGSRSKK